MKGMRANVEISMLGAKANEYHKITPGATSSGVKMWTPEQYRIDD